MEASLTYSPKFLELARAERERLSAKVEDLRKRADDLAASLSDCQAEIEDTLALVREIEDVLGVSDQLRLAVGSYRLGGRELRDVAVSILLERYAGDPIHYTEWFDWVEDAGYRVGGKNPLPTFLAQVVQDPRVERVGNKTGRYRPISS